LHVLVADEDDVHVHLRLEHLADETLRKALGAEVVIPRWDSLTSLADLSDAVVRLRAREALVGTLTNRALHHGRVRVHDERVDAREHSLAPSGQAVHLDAFLRAPVVQRELGEVLDRTIAIVSDDDD